MRCKLCSLDQLKCLFLSQNEGRYQRVTSLMLFGSTGISTLDSVKVVY